MGLRKYRKLATISTNIQKAVELLTQGQVIGFPTETVYGLAGNALDTKAVAQIFQVKNRPTFDPLIVHTSSIGRIESYVDSLPHAARKLAQTFMPGPLTLLLPKATVIPDLVTAGLHTVAIRVPKHPQALALLEALPFPLAAPSANPFGYISPTTAQHVQQQLGMAIPYILNGGACEVGIESTIIGFEAQQAVVYRKGGLAIEDIEAVVGSVLVQEHSTSNPKAPGMLKSHYAPRKPFVLIKPQQTINNPETAAYLGFDAFHPQLPQENQLLLSPKRSLTEAAQNLFGYLRALDSLLVSTIYGSLLPEQNIGRAINDRLRRAGA